MMGLGFRSAGRGVRATGVGHGDDGSYRELLLKPSTAAVSGGPQHLQRFEACNYFGGFSATRWC